MAEHTPPPWSVFYDTFGVHIKNGITWVATLNGYPETKESNARLIAVAPDLLAALETAVASGKSWQGITDARASIAKARGET